MDGGRQLTFGSADVVDPVADDLAGLLAGPGHFVSSTAGVRVSVVVDPGWRVDALVAEFAARGLDPSAEVADGGVSVRTAFAPELAALAARWTRGALRLPPRGLTLGGGALRLWCLGGGDEVAVTGATAWQLRLADEPDGWATTGAALAAAGLPGALIGNPRARRADGDSQVDLRPRGDGPAYRLAGARRLRRLAELVGPAPAGAAAWPG